MDTYAALDGNALLFSLVDKYNENVGSDARHNTERQEHLLQTIETHIDAMRVSPEVRETLRALVNESYLENGYRRMIYSAEFRAVLED